LSKLTVFSALALFLMVADVRFKITQPIRLVVATALRPMQWLVMQPVTWAREGGQYFETLQSAQTREARTRKQLSQLSQRANQVEELALENERLRKMLALRERISTSAQSAQVLYDAADPHTRRIVVDIGMAQNVMLGSPVIDEQGVIGQVTRVYPTASEVTLITDRDQAIPVLNARTGLRGIAFGENTANSSAMELRFMAANADVQPGDLLTTSGVDGVYPPGLPVARVTKVDRRVDSAFARVSCSPAGLVAGSLHVMVLAPVTAQISSRPEPDPAPLALVKKGSKP
jgi:rod shape-determining protein MreC